MPFTLLHELEVANAFAWLLGRGCITAAEHRAIRAQMRDDVEAQRLVPTALDWPQAFAGACGLSDNGRSAGTNTSTKGAGRSRRKRSRRSSPRHGQCPSLARAPPPVWNPTGFRPWTRSPTSGCGCTVPTSRSGKRLGIRRKGGLEPSRYGYRQPLKPDGIEANRSRPGKTGVGCLVSRMSEPAWGRVVPLGLHVIARTGAAEVSGGAALRNHRAKRRSGSPGGGAAWRQGRDGPGTAQRDFYASVQLRDAAGR